MRRPIFVHPLSTEERAMLEERWHSSRPLEQMHIRIVLESSEGVTAAEIAQRLGWTPRAVRRVIQRYNHGGMASLGDRRRMNPGRRRMVTDEWQVLLLTVIEQPPSAYGFTSPRWTARLLSAALVQIDQIHVSEERVRHYLRRHGYHFADRDWRKVPPSIPAVIVDTESDATVNDSLGLPADYARVLPEEDVSS